MKTIKVKIRTVYGNELVYPVCDDAKTFARISGTKTLGQQTISMIKALGYTVTVEQQTL